jgi:hypothetical protein
MISSTIPPVARLCRQLKSRILIPTLALTISRSRTDVGRSSIYSILPRHDLPVSSTVLPLFLKDLLAEAIQSRYASLFDGSAFMYSQVVGTSPLIPQHVRILLSSLGDKLLGWITHSPT